MNPTTQAAGELSSKVKAACEECRARKTKCDAARPVCTRCRQKGRTCVYATEPDEFRVTALRRRYAELAQSASDNEAVLRLLREESQGEANEILERIRANESIASILSSLAEQGHPAERALMRAIERANELTAEATGGPSGSQAEGRSRTSTDKHSVAFMMSTPTPPDPTLGETSALAGSDVLAMGPPARSRAAPATGQAEKDPVEQTASRPDLAGSSKQASAASSKRASAAEHIASRPPSSRARQGTGAGAEAATSLSRGRQHDKSWMQGLENVKAADWEVHYADDQTFLEILKCYFAWENHVIPLINESSFWEGLKAGGSEFCNRALIHACIAFGSKIYSMFNPTKAASAEHLALVEATKMWDWDADAAVPANASAGLLIHATFTANGQDRDGASYLAGAMNLAVRSGLFSRDRMQQVYPDSNPELAKNRAEFAWNVYSYHGYHTLTFNKPHLLPNEPPVEIPDIDGQEDRHEWTPFPLPGPSRASLVNAEFQAKSSLWRLGNTILPLHRRNDNNLKSVDHWRAVWALYEEFRSWQAGLGHRLNNLHGAPPRVFAMHCDYHRCVLDLFRPFVNNKDPPSREITERVRTVTNESHNQLRLLVHQMELQQPGLPITLSTLVTPLVSVANETLTLMRHQGPDSDEAFYFSLCVKLMRRMVVPYPLMRFLILGLQQIAARQGVNLPSEAIEVVDDLRQERRRSFALNSAYPVHHDLLITDLEAARLQSLIDETDSMNLALGSGGGPLGGSRTQD